MRNRILFWQFFGAHIVILIVAVGSVALYAWHTSSREFHRQWIRELESQAKLAAALLPRGDGAVDDVAAQRFMERLKVLGDRRFTLILPDGKVLGDSESDASRMDLHHERPEVKMAKRTGMGISERYSATLGKPMLYLAQRVPPDGPEQAVVRVSVPVRSLTHELASTHRTLFLLLGVVLVATLVLSYWAALRIIGPVSAFREGLDRIGGGDLSHRLAVPAVPHLAELARAINRTADRLQKYIQAVDDERNMRALILANMTRGVIAIDRRHAVMDINDSARQMLGLKEPVAEGTRIGEAVRYAELLALIDASERQEGPVEREMVIGEAGDILLNMRATALKDRESNRVGTLMVLSDVTVLRKLERVRQDFVANVSHELRTPVTSVKGFAETLLDGAMNDAATAERFLKIIVRQASQLETIIRDLLDLSRLEQSSSQTLERQETPVAGVLKSAVELCQARASERGLTVMIDCAEKLSVQMHAGLIEQAVVNLIDNAIKYGATAEQPQVVVSARREGACVRLAVRDFGHGVERAHLDRLFERFYRVDKGRSREMGGTGLGLAIVKHIVLIHGGTVGVESELGQGATFSLYLPA